MLGWRVDVEWCDVEVTVLFHMQAHEPVPAAGLSAVVRVSLGT